MQRKFPKKMVFKKSLREEFNELVQQLKHFIQPKKLIPITVHAPRPRSLPIRKFS